MSKFISLVQLKGGAGKSTIVANLCGYLLGKGKSVLTVDGDMPQGTLTAWAGLFTQNKESKKYEHVSVNNVEELLSVLQQAENQFDYILIDSPPRMADMMKAILVVSDLVLVPLNVTSPDIWAVTDMVELIKDATNERPELNVQLVFNKFKDKSSNWQTRNEVIANTELPAIKTALFDYDTYSTVIGKGTHVCDYHIRAPKAQFSAFAKEALKTIQS